MAVSVNFRREVQAQETGEVFIALLTITHPDSAGVSRVSSDPTTRLGDDPLRYGTASRGQTFEYLPFTITLPNSGGESTPVAQISLDNIGRELTALIRSAVKPATLLLEVVCASTPDTVERSFPNLKVADVNYDAEAMTFSLTYQPLVHEPFPAHAFVPSYFPGLFP